MPRLCFIFNPHSGGNRRRPWQAARLRDWIAAAHLDASLCATEGPHHATELARDAVARGCERVVAVGGDGTMNEVARALVETPVVLGLLPCGSGNGLGRHLGISGRLPEAFRLVAAGRVIAIDTGLANEHPFFNVMGCGFDAEVGHRFNGQPRRGLPTYLRTAGRMFFRYQPETYTLAGDGWAQTLPAFLVTIANSDQYGNGARIAPGARVDDGRFNLVAVPPVSLFGVAGFVVSLFYGSFTTHPRILHRTGAHFTLQRRAPGLIHVDGETRDTAATIEVRVRPLSLRIVVPEQPCR